MEQYLSDSLREWTSHYNIGVKAVNDLLKILHPHINYLPLDFRTLMKTPRHPKSITT